MPTYFNVIAANATSSFASINGILMAAISFLSLSLCCEKNNEILTENPNM